MAFQYHADTAALGTVLMGSLGGGPAKPLVVPDYQRSYSWTTEEVDALWSDVSRFAERFPGAGLKDRSYFLGAVVLVDGADAYEILDGQQRIATCTIFLAAVRDHLKEGGRAAAAQSLSEKFLAGVDYPSETTQPRLSLNIYDREFFRLCIQEGAQPDSPKTAAQRRIQLAQETARLRVQTFCGDAATDAGYKRALGLQELFTAHVSMVAVISDSEDEAADIFEALNDRGISLSTPDLVRTLLIRRAKPTDRDSIVDQWGELFELEAPAKIDDLLRYYWITREGDQKTRSLYRVIREKVTASASPILPPDFTKELTDAGEAYEGMMRGESDSEALERVYLAAKALNAKALYPAFLAMHFRGLGVPPWAGVLGQALISVYVRHTVIGGLSNSTLETWVYALAKDLRHGLEKDEALERVRTWLVADPAFHERFSMVSIQRQATVRYLLNEIEGFLQTTAELTPAGSSVNHIEHIYPKTPPKDLKWDDHNEQIWRLGNLTLLSGALNGSAKNFPYQKKRTEHYAKSNLQMVKALPDIPEWTPLAIAERQRVLADCAVKIWTC